MERVRPDKEGQSGLDRMGVQGIAAKEKPRFAGDYLNNPFNNPKLKHTSVVKATHKPSSLTDDNTLEEQEAPKKSW